MIISPNLPESPSFVPTVPELETLEKVEEPSFLPGMFKESMMEFELGIGSVPQIQVIPLAEPDVEVEPDVETGLELEPDWMPVSGEGLDPRLGILFPGSLADVPALVITNSFDDDEEEDEMEDVPDEEDDDVYEEVEAFEDFDDEFDEDFEDEFDEDYEDLARIDDEEIEDEEDEDANGTPARYEEEFGDVDGQAKFIPDSGEIALNEEVLLSEDDLEESDSSDFDDFTEDEEGEEFNEFDNEI